MTAAEDSGASPREWPLRLVENRDAQDLFGLLALCFAEYPGCFVDPHCDLADLREPAAATAEREGAFWVIEDHAGRICACIAVDFPEARVMELHRLYVRPDRRRRGLAARLVETAEAFARARGSTHVVLWSDTRFRDAHRLYERLGYCQTGKVRDLGDISHSVEHHFEKRLTDDAGSGESYAVGSLISA
ncbi:GNAT family N-acetyltransferase [Microvirga massiliensis]|uniref:GNAT family N-acetyltransferase n=1 Tax=Microvirga massiliensis TaxID=1033741 RepID=UPI000AAB89C1|nr:GNAT family N-acetyltransferase [Microvirga massiliensis]